MSLPSTPVNLAIQFSSAVLTTSFNDGTSYQFDPTGPPSAAQWRGSWAGPLAPLPAQYLALPVVTDAAAYTWLWFPSLPNITIALPAGPLSLGGLLQGIYASSKQQISPDDYAQVAGVPYDASQHGGGTPTVAIALQDGAAQNGAAPSLGSVVQLDAATMFIRAS